jgi:hypothetical protein
MHDVSKLLRIRSNKREHLTDRLVDEDFCQQCTDDFANGVRHIDIWTGSSTDNGGSGQVQCEDDLTPESIDNVIIRSPDSSYSVDTNPLYQSVC